MRLTLKRSLTSLAISLLLVSVVSGTAEAAASSSTNSSSSSATNSGQALEIAPPVIYLSANPGQTLTTQILIRDISSSNLVVTSQVNDFVAAGLDGTPRVLLNNPSNNPYSMRTWVTPPASLVLVPRQIKTVTVSIRVPANASPGGHYGVIRFTGTPQSLQTSGVSLSASLGALMLMTVSGKISHHLSVTSFTVDKNGKSGGFFQSGPLSFSEIFKNSGDVHEQPTGELIVKDMFGHSLANLPVNQPPGNVLPGSERQFSQDLNSSVIGSKKLFGSYSATLKVTYGNPAQTLTASLSFWVLPIKLIALIIILLIAAFFGLRYAIKRYNRYIIRRGQNNQRPGPPPATPPAASL